MGNAKEKNKTEDRRMWKGAIYRVVREGFSEKVSETSWRGESATQSRVGGRGWELKQGQQKVQRPWEGAKPGMLENSREAIVAEAMKGSNKIGKRGHKRQVT